jgi:putative ABC transport system permease protein
MIKHYFKLAWNKKRANFLVMVEILAAFLVVFAVATLATYSTNNYRQPLGYEWNDVWVVQIVPPNMRSGSVSSSGTPDPKAPDPVEVARIEKIRQMMAAIREIDGVEIVSAANSPAYGNSANTHNHTTNGKRIAYEIDRVTDAYQDVMKLRVLRGRWFSKEDDGVEFRPVVISQNAAEDWFPGEDPLGKTISQPEEPGPPQRVIGVISAFRKNGEFGSPPNFVFERARLDVTNRRNWAPNWLVLRVRPGTTAATEERVIRRLQTEGKDWSFEIQRMDRMREETNRPYQILLAGASVLAGFLLLMVGLGLTGVLWQNVTQRTREIGVRRAQGATIRDIYFQILGELLFLTTFGVFIGVLIVIQFPILNFIGFVPNGVYAVGIGVSLATIYLLTLLCGLYPSWLATRVQPAAALHCD